MLRRTAEIGSNLQTADRDQLVNEIEKLRDVLRAISRAARGK
jgi:hypothetical protein